MPIQSTLYWHEPIATAKANILMGYGDDLLAMQMHGVQIARPVRMVVVTVTCL